MNSLASCAAAALVLSLALPVQAQDRAERVAKMLSHVPLGADDADRTFELQYGDPQAGLPVLLLATGDPETATLFSAGRGLPTGIAQNLVIIAQASTDLVGFDLTQSLESASVTQPPALMTLYRLDRGAAARVGPALDALGYDRVIRFGVPVWARGEDNEVDIAARDPANPFGGALGRPGRVAVADDLVAWSPAWGPIIGVTAGAAGMDTHPQIAALIAALDRPEAGSGTLIAAHFMIGAADNVGSPAVMITDMVDGAQDVSLLALVVPPGRDPEALRRTIERNWDSRVLPGMRSTMADLLRSGPDLRLVAGEVPVLLIRVTIPRDSAAVNRAFQRAITLVYGADLGALLSD